MTLKVSGDIEGHTLFISLSKAGTVHIFRCRVCRKNVKFEIKVDEDDIYERIEEQGYEDFERGSLHGTDELEAALRAFEKANEGAVSYEPDYSKALLLSPKRASQDRLVCDSAEQGCVTSLP